MKRAAMIAAVVGVFAASVAVGGEIGFLEDFALAKDRSAPLKQLIPGTEDYYYYHCIHYQNQGQLADVDKMLQAWIKRTNRTRRVLEIENRQALLRYDKDPRGSLEHIRRRLNLRFNHQREIMGQKPKLPTRLDPNLVTRDAYARRALQRHSRTLQGFEDRALEWVNATRLDPDRRRHLLRRLKRPDYPNLPKLVVDDLNHRHSRGFGSHPVHRHMLRAQLDECLRLKADLLNRNHFVNAYLTKLRPNPDADWKHDPKVRQAYLDRLWAFVSRLAPAHNSLKAHVLYHRLVHDRAIGVYDRDRFLTYIKLPRRARYVNADYLKSIEHRRYPANLNADYRRYTLLPRVGNDEPLVRSYLLRYFVTDNSPRPYATYINDLYLKHAFAEAKIVNGIGDMEQWYSMLPPATYKALKERIDLDFAPTNKTAFGVDDPVTLDLHIKNVKTLIVKVFEINTLNYFRAEGRALHTGIDLDGLVANTEKVHTYAEPPLRRVKRTFKFPALSKRGAYIIEFIGSGKSSRALIRKGRLQFLVRTSTAGHVFTVLDEANKPLPTATLWIAGHEYKPDKAGAIAVPFSNKPGRQPVILVHNGFATLDTFRHEAERYELTAGVHVDREALLKRQKASVVVRPSLRLNGMPVTLSVLEQPTLVITSVDREGVSTTKEVADFKLAEDRESVYEFQVPEGLASIGFALKAKVQNLSQNKKQDVAVSRQFALNGIDRTDKVDDVHFVHSTAGYALDVLGKTGEVRPDRPVKLELKHRGFRDTLHVTLQSDARGRITLGGLKAIAWLRAQAPDGPQHMWYPLDDAHSYPSTVHGRAGEAIVLPYMGTAKAPQRVELSLLERRGGTFVRDCFGSLAIRDGFVQISDLPAGDYDLLLKHPGHHVTVRLTQGQASHGHVLSANRHLQVLNAKPLQIAAVQTTNDAITVRLANATKFARVHVAATRYAPEYPLYPHLSVPFAEPDIITTPKVESIYLEERDIGDEYRYIIERKYAKKHPGVMLKRPSLLLNPWAVRKTETGRQDAKPGEPARSESGRAFGGRGGALARQRGRAARVSHFANLDFLPATSLVLTNLRPDAKGTITIKRADLAGHQQLHIVAVDPLNTAYREVALPETDLTPNDLRLIAGLDPARHFAEQKQVSFAAKGKPFVLPDITTSTFEPYDTLGKVYGLYATLSSNATLTEFGFILRWPKLKAEEKRELYSKHACHELSFLLHRKDPAFFEKVVQPYLRNKKDKTFMDHWLLGDDLRGYLKPWAFGQLNIVERILLARRIAAEHPHMARHVKDLLDLIPPDIERFNHLFKTALKTSALETDDELGIEKATREAKGRRKSEALKRLADSLSGKRMSKARAEGAIPAATRAPGAPPRPKAVPRIDAPSARPLKKAKLAESLDKLEAEEMEADADEKANGFFKRDANKRRAVRQFFRKLDKTQEWAENNYYHLPIEQQNAKLITVNAFWEDFARHDGKTPFYSVHLAEATRSFPEMMLALAVLDLPFEAAKHTPEVKGARFALTPGSPMVVFHKQIREAQQAEDKVPILVSQNFFRHGDRYRHVGNERFDKYVADEFLVHVVYGCHVVITNPTSARQKLDVLLQIPRGAMPVSNGQYTRSVHIDLEPYRTQTFDYYFYFPSVGTFPHYPVHVAKNEKLVAFAKPATLHAVAQLTKIDKTSWDYISQNGTADEVIDYLKAHNVERTKLARIAWRCQDAAFFRRVLPLLVQRHAYDHTLWSYGIKHNEPAAAREYLQHCTSFVRQCGDYIDTRLLTIDPVVRKSYQHLEYWPLVNARAHRLGKRRQILNNRFFAQYMHLMKVLSYRPKLDDTDRMTVVCYLLTQDRVDEALALFRQVDATKLGTSLQHDYAAATLDFYSAKPTRAREIATKYAAHPVDRWRKLFANVAAQLDEIEGKGPKVVDKDDRDQQQARLAATEASFDFKVEARQLTVNYQNVKEAVVRYYLMDIELLFSRNPFVQQFSGQFSVIRPNFTQTIAFPANASTHTFALPQQFHSSNVLIEVAASGVKKTQAYYANSLVTQVIETYGQVKVTHADTKKPLPTVYVKAYARMKGGKVRFYKDGYTDLRGRFDYASLSTNELDGVERFSLLILSEAHGAIVREAAPPKQ